MNEVSGIKLSIYGRAKQKTNYLPPVHPAHSGGSDQARELDASPFCREEKCKTERSLSIAVVNCSQAWGSWICFQSLGMIQCGSWLRSLGSWSCPLTHPFFLKEGICLQLRSLLRLRPASRTWVFSLGLFPFYTLCPLQAKLTVCLLR